MNGLRGMRALRTGREAAVTPQVRSTSVQVRMSVKVSGKYVSKGGNRGKWGNRTCGIGAYLCLGELTEHTAYARHGADGEHEIKSNLSGQRHFLDCPQDYDRNCQQAEVHGDVGDAQNRANEAIGQTLGRTVKLAGRDRIEAGPRWVALEKVQKEGGEGVGHKKAKERPMGDHPPVRGEAGKAHVEHDDGHFDDPNRNEED